MSRARAKLRIVIENTGEEWRLRSFIPHLHFFWRGSRGRSYATFEKLMLDLASTHLLAQKAAGMPVPDRKHRRRLAQRLATRLVR